MAQPRVLVLRAAGTNCDAEACHAWELAGAAAERVHLRRLIEKPNLLDGFQVLTIPGGFSYGDDISAGRIFAAQLERELSEPLREFVESGRLILGICNGFQILVKARVLPQFGATTGGVAVHASAQIGAATIGQGCASGGALAIGDDGAAATQRMPRTCTITYNNPRGFQDRWVTLCAAPTSHCVFLEPGRTYEMPIAHGEGRVVFTSPADLTAAERRGLIALRYCEPKHDDTRAQGPFNPNGSTADIAGLCDPTGRVLGLMPHPERFVTGTQHPCWTSRPPITSGDGLLLFSRAISYTRAL